jgi:hypothetical protein
VADNLTSSKTHLEKDVSYFLMHPSRQLQLEYKLCTLLKMIWFRFETTETGSIEPKETEDPPKQFKQEYIWYFSENLGLFRFVSVCYQTRLRCRVFSFPLCG